MAGGALGGTAELLDEKDSTPEHFLVTVTTAGSPVSITPATAKPIQLALIKNPSKGANANTNPNHVVYINIDGAGTPKFMSLNRGEYMFLPGLFTTLKIDASSNGVKAEVIVWS
jgi:hypothetical protein